MRLESRIAIVTGAAQGLGYAIAARFGAEGARVFVADVNREKAEDAARRLAAAGAPVSTVAVDVADSASVAAMVETVIAAAGGIDILVNNAGGGGAERAENIEDVTDAIWHDVMARNLTGAFLCARAVVPHMRARGHGRIINLSSGLAKGVGPVQGVSGAVLPYASAKAGILGLTYTLAKSLGASGITVNAIVPGFMLTEPGTRVRAWYDALPDAGRAALNARNAMGRPGTPDEVASLALFLASEESGYVCGAAIDIHGGG